MNDIEGPGFQEIRADVLMTKKVLTDLAPVLPGY